jgi:lipase maturation factor 1
MQDRVTAAIVWLFGSRPGASGYLLTRWLFLRALGLIYFSAFFALAFQIHGLIGQHGILPADRYLQAVAHALGGLRFWFAPSLLWLSTSSGMLAALCWIGMMASLLLVANIWPRLSLFICFLCFLSFVAAAQEFSGYQSDGMLLEAGFLSLFFASPGIFPGLGEQHPPSRASLFLLRWEWFCIYFESGLVKLASGDPEWRNLTAMNDYYQNGPLPTWIGWYVQHLPNWFHISTAFATLLLELVLVWMVFLPRRWRILCFFIVTPWEIVVILTANYAFLNYLVLVLGFLLLDDHFLKQFLPSAITGRLFERPGKAEEIKKEEASQTVASQSMSGWLRLGVSGVMLTWIFYVTAAQMVRILRPRAPLPTRPGIILEPFRIVDQYGLFAVMTRGRYEVEFQGSNDGQTWVAYPFRYKPQDLAKAPRIYAPYQPRLDWNLWFASLESWNSNGIVPNTEVGLLKQSPDVLELFASNPFPQHPPKYVRAVLWQYWFTDRQERRGQGTWWKHKLLGVYAPTLELESDGKPAAIEFPGPLPPHR